MLIHSKDSFEITHLKSYGWKEETLNYSQDAVGSLIQDGKRNGSGYEWDSSGAPAGDTEPSVSQEGSPQAGRSRYWER